MRICLYEMDLLCQPAPSKLLQDDNNFSQTCQQLGTYTCKGVQVVATTCKHAELLVPNYWKKPLQLVASLMRLKLVTIAM
jgi:hypothetical protein